MSTHSDHRPGRPLRGEHRPAKTAVQVRLTDDELAALDAHRGDLSRAAFLRAALRSMVEGVCR